MKNTTKPSRVRSKQVATTFSPVWLTIDLLLVAVIVLAVLAGKNFLSEISTMNPHYEETMAELREEEEELERQIAEAKTSAVTRAEAAEAQLAALQEEYDACYPAYEEAAKKETRLNSQYTQLCETVETIYAYPDTLQELRTAYGTAVRELEEKIQAGESSYKICYLTFDDGPSYYTNRFLTKLAKYENVHVTFFTIGVEMSSSDTALRDKYLREEAMAGHSIGNHSYSHKYYGSLYSSLSNFIADVTQQDEVVYNATGLHTELFRFPAGSHYCKFRTSAIEALHEKGMKYVDWCGNCFDSGNNNYSASRTASIIISQVRTKDIIIVLCHDWKLNTLEALDTVIPTLQEEGYLFLPLFKESSMLEEATTPNWD